MKIRVLLSWISCPLFVSLALAREEAHLLAQIHRARAVDKRQQQHQAGAFDGNHAPEAQNCPTLSRVNESTASGGLPALIDAMIFGSSTPPVLLTVIHGYFFVNPTKIWLN